jgi:hypothetical protein
MASLAEIGSPVTIMRTARSTPTNLHSHHTNIRRLREDCSSTYKYDSGKARGMSRHPNTRHQLNLLEKAEFPRSPSSQRESQHMQVHRLFLQDEPMSVNLPGQSLCPATPRKDAQLDLRQCQLGQRVGQAVVAAQRKLQLQTRIQRKS